MQTSAFQSHGFCYDWIPRNLECDPWMRRQHSCHRPGTRRQRRTSVVWLVLIDRIVQSRYRPCRKSVDLTSVDLTVETVAVCLAELVAMHLDPLTVAVDVASVAESVAEATVQDTDVVCTLEPELLEVA